MNICGFMFPESTNFNCFIFVYWGSSEKQQIYVYMCIHAQREIQFKELARKIAVPWPVQKLEGVSWQAGDSGWGSPGRIPSCLEKVDLSSIQALK